MQGFIGAKDVLSAERLAELSKRRNWPGLVQLSSHFGAIAVTSWGLSASWGSWWSLPLFIPVSYTHLTLPTNREV